MHDLVADYVIPDWGDRREAFNLRSAMKTGTASSPATPTGVPVTRVGDEDDQVA